MNNNELLLRLREYGADTDAILDRFLGDIDFYRECLAEYFNDGYFRALDDAIAAADYQAAFEAAHALKGTSGNMGLIPVYTAICGLVEVLRTRQYDEVAEKYAATKAALQIVEELNR